MKIAVIDDDVSFLKACALTLSECGNVKTFKSAHEAFEELRDCNVVITDLKMDGHDGIDVLKYIRKEKLPIPVIITTAHATKEAAILAANLHVFAILEKPMDEAVLRDTVGRAILAPSPGSLGGFAQEVPKEDSLELCSQSLSVRLNGTKVLLTDTEYRLLSFFKANNGQRVSRDNICSELWPGTKTTKNLFDTHLVNLKRKVPVLSRLLRVVRGKGYIYNE